MVASDWIVIFVAIAFFFVGWKPPRPIRRAARKRRKG